MPPWVSSLADVCEADAARFGYKAVTLAEMCRAGFPVPHGIAVSGEAYEHQARTVFGAEWRRVVRTARSLAEMRETFRSYSLPDTLVADVVTAAAPYDLLGGRLLAVRSSSTTEDRESASGAGIQVSRLGVVGLEGVLDALRDVWASMWTEQAQCYHEQASASGPVLMGAVIQELVHPDAAGVLFTVNPVTGDSRELLINSAFGLGEPVLSGHITPDSFVVDRRSLAVTSTSIALKRFAVFPGPGGLVTRELGSDQRRAPSLDDLAVREVAALGLRVEARASAPRDVEWARAGGRVFLLQSRPITALAPAGDRVTEPVRSRDSRDVWTNANVGEALPGVATPLTWSIAVQYSERGFRRAFGALGCEVPEGAELVGQFRGRIYLNLSQFVAIASQVPLLDARTLSEIGGARWPDDVELPQSTGGWRITRAFLRRIPGAIARLTIQNVGVERGIDALEVRVDEAWRRLRRSDLSRLTDRRLDAELSDVDVLLEATGDAMLTCAANSLGSYLGLRFLVARWLGRQAAGIERDLLAGAADLESARPGVALWHIAEAARADDATAKVLQEHHPGELRVESLPPGSKVRHDLEAFIETYGYRAVREAELMTPRWAEDPSLIFAILREYLRSGGPAPGQELEERLVARRRSWQLVDRELDPVRRKVVRRLVELSRRYHRLRERLRADVTKVLGLYRIIALDVSRRIGSPDAAFFLTIEEAHRLLREGWSPSSRGGIGPLVAARRRSFALDASLPDPPATFVGSPPEPEAPELPRDRRHLEGVASSPGKAIGEARVLSHSDEASELRAGEILVVSCADVGWSPLFLLAGAIVTELGGVLSHAAVVAREYRVPAVLSVPDATRRILTGQRILVDGDTGVVELLDCT
jgi:pyruvate,water dikinase